MNDHIDKWLWKENNLNPIKMKKKNIKVATKYNKNSKPHNHALSSDTPSHNSYTIEPSSSSADRPKNA